MSYYTVGKYPRVKTLSSDVLPQAPSPLCRIRQPSYISSHSLDMFRDIQQHQLALDRLRAPTQRHLALGLPLSEPSNTRSECAEGCEVEGRVM